MPSDELSKTLTATEELLQRLGDIVKKRSAKGLAAVWILVTIGGYSRLKEVANFFSWKLPADAPRYWLIGTAVFGLGSVFYALLFPRSEPVRNTSNLQANRVLKPFLKEDASVFAQLERNDILTELEVAIRDPGFRIGTLMSQSGNGKTSLIQAGLLPHLNDTKENGTRCVYVGCTDKSPLLSLRLALAEPFKLPLPELHTAATLLDVLAKLPAADTQPIVLLFDQFEQYFLHLNGPLVNDTFVQNLREWYAQRLNWQVKLVFSLRNDFASQLGELLYEVNCRRPDAAFPLKQLTTEQAGRILQVIADQAGISYDPSFTEQLTLQFDQRRAAGSVWREEGISPVDLQVLARLVLERNSTDKTKTFTFDGEAFKELGGIEGALERYLEQRLPPRSEEGRRENVLKTLLALTNDSVRTGILPTKEVATRAGLAIDDTQAALKWLTATELVIQGTVALDGADDDGVELAHERLIQPLRNLTRNTSEPATQAYFLLEHRVNAWISDNYSNRFLLSFLEWLRVLRYRPQALLEPHYDQKIQLLARTKLRWQRRAFSLGALILLVMLGWNWWQSGDGIIWRSRQDLYAMARDNASEETVQASASQAYWLAGDVKQALALAKSEQSIKFAVLDSLLETAGKSTNPSQAALDTLLQATNGLANRSDLLPTIAQAYGKFHNSTRGVAALDTLLQTFDVRQAYARVRLLINIAQAYGQLYTPAKATVALDTLLQNSKGRMVDFEINRWLPRIAQVCWQLHNPAKGVAAINTLQQATRSWRPLERPWILINIAQAYVQLHNPNQAAAALDTALQASKDWQADNWARVVPIISQVYGQLHDPTRAADVLDTALQTTKGLANRSNLLRAIAHAYGQLHDSTRAAAGLDTILHASKGWDTYDKSRVLPAIAQAYGQLHNPARADAALDSALQATKKLHSFIKVDALPNVAQAYGQLHSSARAAAGLNVLLQETKGWKDSDKSRVLPAIAQAYEQQHLWQQAYATIDDIQLKPVRARELYILIRMLGD